MRMFIAVPLPEEVIRSIETVQEKCRPFDLHMKWVRPENCHITVKFLGEVDPDHIETFSGALQELAPKTAPFDVVFSELGFFPRPRRPRVFILNAPQAEKLTRFADALESRLRTVSPPRDKCFRAHITLGRFKSGRNLSLLKAALEKLHAAYRVPVDRIVLYQSTLTKEGPVYEPLGSFLFTGKDSGKE
ncbi:MAG: RNA 2',3'-cyclic phosphodiesterase [Candidatus Omnitrophica bacterium]|nr:RNA 2',3'-cyclic phosphodiesterase [Candidatus Omnitrophota bacterium]